MNAGPSEQDDDWMIRSMTRYDSLYMFELPQPTRCIEWSRQGTAICVAGYLSETSSEITQLALPEKLLPVQDQTHWAKRDFHLINGAISTTPITTLKHLASTDTLASAGGEPLITLWKADHQDTDCLKEVDKLELSLPPTLSCDKKDPLTKSLTFIDALDEDHNTLLTAISASLCTVQTLDLATGKCTFILKGAQNERRVHGLAFVPGADGLIVTCSGEGGVDVWDTRAKDPSVSGTDAKVGTEHNESKVTTGSSDMCGFAISNESHPCTKVAILHANSGNVKLYDIRQLKELLGSCQLEGADSVRGWFKKRVSVSCVKFSDGNSSLVSISGCTAGVSVYDCSKWTTHCRATPLFTHTGHEEDSPTAQVLTHSWQPKTTATILSVDSDGSLHAWQWKQ